MTGQELILEFDKMSEKRQIAVLSYLNKYYKYVFNVASMGPNERKFYTSKLKRS